MKRAVSFVLVLLILLACSSCSYVFSGFIQGSVDDGNGNPVDAKILIYESKNARDDDYDRALGLSYQGSYENMESSCIKVAETASGVFSTRVTWKTSSSMYGEDYDMRGYYLLVLADGYYPVTADAPSVMSGSGAPYQMGTISVTERYNQEAVISGFVTENKEPNAVTSIYVYSEKDEYDSALENMKKAFSADPATYADGFDAGKYHGYAISNAIGRYEIKVMWNDGTSSGTSSHQYYVLAACNGYDPEKEISLTSSVTCETGANKEIDITLVKAEEEAE